MLSERNHFRRATTRDYVRIVIKLNGDLDDLIVGVRLLWFVIYR